MNVRRLLRTAAVRLALTYALVYALVLGLSLAALTWSTTRHIDAQMEADLEQALGSLVKEYEDGGAERLRVVVAQRQASGLPERELSLLISATGERLAGNLLRWPAESTLAMDGKAHSVWVEEEVLPRGLHDDDAYLPVVAKVLPDGSRLVLARSVRQSEELQELTEYLLEALGAAVVLALLMGVTLGQTILRRMEAISHTAGEIMAGDLSKRVPVSGRQDDFDALAARLNGMLDRIQQLIKGIREVTDNVAHDLRSPLTRLRNRLEVTLMGHHSEAEYRQVIGQGIEDVDSLIETFNTLLGIAQAEAGSRRAQWESVDLGRLAKDLVDLYKPVADEKGLRLSLHCGGRVEITSCRDLLAQAIGNLLDNSVKYTPEGGSIDVHVNTTTDAVELVVADTGPGIPAWERTHVLERFVRLEGSRHAPGNGLGLSLVQAVATLHGAELRLEDGQPGLKVTLRFSRLPKAVLPHG